MKLFIAILLASIVLAFLAILIYGSTHGGSDAARDSQSDASAEQN